MSLPTLLVKGKLFPPNGDAALKAELDTWVPLDYVINWFRRRLDKIGMENRVLVLKAETASGKSTAFPPELFLKLVRGGDKNAPGIICTQPRVMTAIENVTEILKWQSKVLKLGDTIGWSTKFNKLRPVSVGLLSATLQTLTQQLKTHTDDEIMDKYRFILIDEAHERSLQTDMTLYMLKNLLGRNKNNPKCPFVVVMSATFEPSSFLAYFDVPLLTNFIWCRGAPAGHTEMWDWNEGRTVNNYMQSAAEVVEKIITENPTDESSKADILIFMPGAAEFMETEKYLVKLNEKFVAAGTSPFSLLKIEAEAVKTQNLDYLRVTKIPVARHIVTIKDVEYVPSRRVIISTNVAETGLTLDNLKYVIDAGYNREVEYNPVLGISGLLTKPAPKSRIEQRKGRAGRKFPGIFYPLYPKYVYDKLQAIQYPQIIVEDIGSIILDIIAEQIKAKTLAGEREPQFLVSDIDMIDVPTPDAVAQCIETLYVLGFISPAGADGRFTLTKMGTIASTISSVTPELARMIMASYFWECSTLDIIAMVAYVTLEPRSFEIGKKDVFINWSAVFKLGLPGWVGSPTMLYKIKLLIADEFIYGLMLFNAVRYLISSAGVRDGIMSLTNWCNQHGLKAEMCIELIRVRDTIIEQMIMSGLDVFSREEYSVMQVPESGFMNSITKLKYCIHDGYKNNILTLRDGAYRTKNGLVVAAPALFRADEIATAEKQSSGFIADMKPSFVLYKNLKAKYNKKTGIFDVIPMCVSMMDGYVSTDPSFDI